MMKWFEGNIPAAIQLAKSQKALFIVFVTGDDGPSQETTRVWDDEAVSQLSAANNCVALKLDSKSQLGVQFAQIYPVMVIPSVFFIAPETGLPLEVSMGQVTVDQLLEKFNKALQMQRPISQFSSPPSTGGSSVSATSVPADPDNTLGATGGNTADVMPGSSIDDGELLDDTADVIPGETLEERKERLLKKMAERRDQKEKEAQDKDRKSEVERRKQGQEAQKFRQWKAEMEKKEFENSYKKEKEEQKRALEKVRADLERDRQERAMKYKQEKAQQEEANERNKKAKLEAEAKRLEKENAAKRESARVQFRLPDGSSVYQIFASSDTLSVARNFIQQRLNVNSVTLSTTFPKRTFIEDDMDRTLLELELVPSSVLIVLFGGTKRSGHMTASQSTGNGFLWMLLAPLIAIWNFIYAFLFPPMPARAGNQNAERLENRSSGSMGNDQSSTPRQRSSVGHQGLRSRNFGNINRLTADDEDDESATWNGNSTQQM